MFVDSTFATSFIQKSTIASINTILYLRTKTPENETRSFFYVILTATFTFSTTFSIEDLCIFSQLRKGQYPSGTLDDARDVKIYVIS